MLNIFNRWTRVRLIIILPECSFASFSKLKVQTAKLDPRVTTKRTSLTPSIIKTPLLHLYDTIFQCSSVCNLKNHHRCTSPRVAHRTRHIFAIASCVVNLALIQSFSDLTRRLDLRMISLRRRGNAQRELHLIYCSNNVKIVVGLFVRVASSLFKILRVIDERTGWMELTDVFPRKLISSWFAFFCFQLARK